MLNIQNHQVFGKDKSDRAIAIIKEKGSGRIAFTARLATEVLFPILFSWQPTKCISRV